MRTKLLLLKVALVAATSLAGGCLTGVYDGQRVSSRTSSVTPAGFVTAPRASGDRMVLQAYHPTRNRWEQLATTTNIDTSPYWTTADGQPLYSYSFGSRTIPTEYWRSGTGGHYTRLRVQWETGGEVYGTAVARGDMLECFLENFDNQGNTLDYMIENCFSHRGEAYVYTQDYREGSSTCAAPASSLALTDGHYMLDQLPGCAQTIVANRMKEHIDLATIQNHYEINHTTASVVTVKGTVGNDAGGTCSRDDFQCNLGGFFGGHERYLRAMERHVMVYDYPWMPQGKIPSWKSNTTVPSAFRSGVPSPVANCDSTSGSCAAGGWLSHTMTSTEAARCNGWAACTIPTNIDGNQACTANNETTLFNRTSGWHNAVHNRLGGVFASFDSPSYPLFFLWHNYVNDVWVRYRSGC